MNPSTSFLNLTVARGVATLTLTRADKGNAYNKAMLRDLAGHLARIADDAAVRVLVLRGQGRHFCAGAEIGADDAASEGPGIADVCLALDSCPKPTLALVQGACLGGGLALIACCDVVIAARDAFFAMPEVRLGFSPGPLMPFIIAAVGARAARRLLVTGERFEADEARRLGLVHSLCEAGETEVAVKHATTEMLQAAPTAVAEIKATLRRMAGQPLAADVRAALQTQFRASTNSPEAQEGRAAFREGRPPKWVVE